MAYAVKKLGYENCPLKKRPFQMLDLNNDEVKDHEKLTNAKQCKTEPQDLSLKHLNCETPPPSPTSDIENRTGVYSCSLPTRHHAYTPSPLRYHYMGCEDFNYVQYSNLHSCFYSRNNGKEHDVRVPVHHMDASLSSRVSYTPPSPQISPPLFLEAKLAIKDKPKYSDMQKSTLLQVKNVPHDKECARFKCDQCQKNYSTTAGLSKHKQFHCKNEEIRTFGCKHCDKMYTSLGALKMHIRTHTLPCKCQFCGKAFSRPWLLQGHIRTHTGEKPFSCTQCQRAFADRSNLRAHLQTHSEIKKYSCKCCRKTFSRLSLLVKHEDNGCPGKISIG